MAGQHQTPVELLDRLVAFDTTSSKTNLPIVEYIRDYLAALGVTPTLVPDEDGGKAALYATIGPMVEGGVVLSAHTDVVPVAGQHWSSDPFTLARRGTRLYARGSADMKGFVANILAAVPEFLAAPLKRPIHIALSYDEEVGCLGVRPLARHMAEHLPPPSAVIVGEPTALRPIDAHKSGYRIETVVTGREAHSSMPAWGVNAVVYAARFVNEIERLGVRLAAQPVTDPRFDPPYPTVNIGEIRGGTAHNIVPRSCRIVWGIRGLPDTDVPALVEEIGTLVETTLAASMRAAAPQTGIETRIVTAILPLRPRPGSSAASLIAELTGIDEMGAVSYGTDGGFFDSIGWPTVVCGPGDIADAHRPDESIEESALIDCAALLRRLADQLAV